MEVRLENGFGGNGLWFDAANRLFNAGIDRHMAPSAEVVETPEGYHVYLEIAGLKSESLDVSVEDETLTIQAERKRPQLTKDARIHLSERHYGWFKRAFELPEDADRSAISATYKDGVLDVAIGKRPETKPVRIQVTYEN